MRFNRCKAAQIRYAGILSDVKFNELNGFAEHRLKRIRFLGSNRPRLTGSLPSAFRKS